MDTDIIQQLRQLAKTNTAKTSELQITWDKAFDKSQPRPTLYNKPTMDTDLPTVADSNTFITQLANAEAMSQAQLYSVLENSHAALHAAQEEHDAIDNYLRRTQGGTTDFPKLPASEEFEDFALHDDQKKATLYGYKFAPKKDYDYHIQDPFRQGGFVPTAAEIAKKRKLKDFDPRNIDGFDPVEKNGKMMVPRLFWEKKPDKQKAPPDATATPARKTRKWTSEEMETSAESRPSSSNSNSTFDNQNSATTQQGQLPTAVENPTINKRTTRYAGKKTPITREVDDSLSPTPPPISSKRRKPNPARSAAISTTNSPAPFASTAAITITPPSRRSRTQNTIHVLGPQASASTSLASETATTTDQTPESSNRTRPTNTSVDRRNAHGPTGDGGVRWNADTLCASIRENDEFLDPDDPVRRKEVREKILAAEQPMRTFAMLFKWKHWRAVGQDKRPRGKNSPKRKSKSKSPKQKTPKKESPERDIPKEDGEK